MSKGLTRAEMEILDKLATVWNAWCKLGCHAESDGNEFQDAIHRAQQLIALRVARRVDPTIWVQPCDQVIGNGALVRTIPPVQPLIEDR
jgi:hypothetical protein